MRKLSINGHSIIDMLVITRGYSIVSESCQAQVFMLCEWWLHARSQVRLPDIPFLLEQKLPSGVISHMAGRKISELNAGFKFRKSRTSMVHFPAGHVWLLKDKTHQWLINNNFWTSPTFQTSSSPFASSQHFSRNFGPMQRSPWVPRQAMALIRWKSNGT